ncbi:MAG: hypothetical protein HWN81_04445 [Candidatus Lokiarchaeota archaeon]|nr:hypothetical protein [Candidatus Lokiarchaeota archaeon]
MSKFEVINIDKDDNSKWEQISNSTLVAIVKDGVHIKDSYYDIINKIMKDENKIMLTTDIFLQNEFNEYYIQRLDNGYIDSFPYFVKKSDHLNPFNPKILDQIRSNLKSKLIEHLSEPVFYYVKIR